jgi:hypothetical protein
MKMMTIKFPSWAKCQIEQDSKEEEEEEEEEQQNPKTIAFPDEILSKCLKAQHRALILA